MKRQTVLLQVVVYNKKSCERGGIHFRQGLKFFFIFIRNTNVDLEIKIHSIYILKVYSIFKGCGKNATRNTI